jgi:hypothetical protein
MIVHAGSHMDQMTRRNLLAAGVAAAVSPGISKAKPLPPLSPGIKDLHAGG